MPEANSSEVTPQQFGTDAFASIRTAVSPLLHKPQIIVEPTPLYRQKKGPVYPDKFKDRSPHVPGAGLLPGPEEESVGKIIKGIEDPPRPENIEKFHNYYFTPHEQRRIHYGQVYDPERQIAAERVHGIPTKQFETSGALLNPRPKSLVEHQLDTMKEAACYHSLKHPIGGIPKPNLPENLDLNTATFGHKTVRNEKGGEIINPPKSFPQVEWESDQCKDLYKLSHSAYFPGEQKHRDYPCFNDMKVYGMPTPNDPRGGKTKKSMDWITECLDRKGARVESERLINYRERFSHQIGKPRDPIADTMRVDPLCHAFGLQSKADTYKAGELIHMRNPKDWLHNHWNRRNAVITEVRRQLKKYSWAAFEQFMNICLAKDKEQAGSITTDEMRHVYKTMGVPVEPEVLEQLLDLCDVGVCGTSGDACEATQPQGPHIGRINYMQMICIMNWTDRNVGDAKTAACLKHNADDPENLAKLEKKIDASVTDYMKTSSVFGANHGVPTRDLRTFGVPSRRSDLPAPRIRKLDDRQNYGDEPGAAALVSPSIFARYGITERDVFMPRTRTEIKTILSHIGVDMTERDFEAIWDRAQTVQPNGGRLAPGRLSSASHKPAPTKDERETLSFEAFRAVLDEIIAVRAARGELIV